MSDPAPWEVAEPAAETSTHSLVEILATLAAHGQTVEYALASYYLPRALYDQMPGDRENAWVDDAGQQHFAKHIDCRDVRVTIYTDEPC